MVKSNILKHNFSNETPTFSDLKVGELGLWVFNNKPRLYTKIFTGEVVEIGKGVEKFLDLEDLDLTNIQNNSFFTYQDGKFVATNTIGSITQLTDLEISNPQPGEYLRYDDLYGAFRNIPVQFGLSELTDVDVADSTNEEESSLQNDHVLIYNHTSGKFETVLRNNKLELLEDVDYTEPSSEDSTPRLLLYDAITDKWKNEYLDISKDLTPKLGGDLNANQKYILNSNYRVVIVEANTPIIEINYEQGDYFIINGVESTELESCIIDVSAFPARVDSSCALVLEIRQKSGQILIGGLMNVHYEDGKPILLSGEGKTDIISILTTRNSSHLSDEYDTYITAAALNLALAGQGGSPAYRYDKNRYPEIQTFNIPNFYDDYFDYVQLLLNFEEEVSTGWLWYEDKSYIHHPVTATASQLATNVYTFGLQEYVASFNEGNEEIEVLPLTAIELDADFTLEFFINYNLDSYYINEVSVTHEYFSSTDLTIRYTGQVIDNIENTTITIELGSKTYTFSNGMRYFRYQNNRYIHIAIVRKGVEVYVYVDGYRATPTSYSSDSPVSELSISSIVCNTHGILNSIRLTKGIARYDENFTVPDMRFGLIGGANDILESIVDDTYYLIGDIDIERNIFT